MDGTFLITIAELVLKHGVPTVIDLIKTWQVDTSNISIQDLEDLKKQKPKSFRDMLDDDS